MSPIRPQDAFPAQLPTATQFDQARDLAFACVDAAQRYQDVFRRYVSPEGGAAEEAAEAYSCLLDARDAYCHNVPQFVRAALFKARRSDFLDLSADIPNPSDHRDGWLLTCDLRHRTRLALEANSDRDPEPLVDRLRACWDEIRKLVLAGPDCRTDACSARKDKILAEYNRAKDGRTLLLGLVQQLAPVGGVNESNQPLPPLKPDDVPVLEVLAGKHPATVFQSDVGAALGLNRSAAGERLNRLLELGLVYKPYGDRGGYTLTDLGWQVLSRLRKTGTD